jgi:hypothetical protein
MQELKAKELNCNIVNDVLVNKIVLALEELTTEAFKLRENTVMIWLSNPK